MTAAEQGAKPETHKVPKAPEAPPLTEGAQAGLAPSPTTARPSLPAQPRNPLHGVTLEAMVTALADHHGWAGLGERIPVRCFNVDPSVTSSLRFLRKTPWARAKVEGLYLAMERQRRRQTPRQG